MLTFQSASNTRVDRFVAIWVGCQDYAGISFYLEQARDDDRLPVEQAGSGFLIVNPAMEKLRKYPAVSPDVISPPFNQAVFNLCIQVGKFSQISFDHIR